MTKEQKKLQKFLDNNNIPANKVTKRFENGKLVLLILAHCDIKGKVSFKDFPDLDFLELKNINGLTDIDLTHNSKLKKLYLNMNNLTNINLTQNPNLKSLSLGHNKLADINLTQNHNLELLYLDDNRLTDIDLTQNYNLKFLVLEDNNFTTVDLTHNTKLSDVYIDPDVEMKITGELHRYYD